MNGQRTSRTYALLIFLLIAVGLSGLLGYFSAPGEWYAGLAKPPFNPPNWVFAPVWLILYFLIAVAGWLVWIRAPRSPAMAVWAAQMLANWIWAPVFFRLQAPWLAVVIVLVMFVLILSFIGLAQRIDRRAALLFVPYALWVAFAGALNVSVAALN